MCHLAGRGELCGVAGKEGLFKTGVEGVRVGWGVVISKESNVLGRVALPLGERKGRSVGYLLVVNQKILVWLVKGYIPGCRGGGLKSALRLSTKS